MPRSLYSRLAVVTTVALLTAIPFVLAGVDGAFSKMHNVPVLWLPESSGPRQDFESFLEEFQADDTIVVSWDDCTYNDERLQALADAIQDPERVQELKAETNLSGHVLEGYSAVRELSETLDVGLTDAAERLRGLLVGRDGSTSCALITYHYRGEGRREKSIELILDEVVKAGVPRESIHIAGSVVEGVAIDAESSRSFDAYVLPSGLITVIVCLVCLRSWRLTMAVIFVSGFCEGLVLAIVYWTGIQMNAILIVMAPLIFVLAVSAGVHLANYYREECWSGLNGAVDRALGAGWWPCTFCALTTAIGMASLMVSQIIPIRQFGAITSFGVLLTLGLLFLVLPGSMEWTSRHLQKVTPSGAQDSLAHPERWRRLTSFLQRTWPVVMVVGLQMMLLGVLGVCKVTTTVEVLSLLRDEHPLVQDYRWFEDRLGALVPLEVIVHVSSDPQLDTLEQVETIRKIEARLKESSTLGGVVSATTFLPEIPPLGGLSQKFRRLSMGKRIDSLRPELEEHAWLFQSDGGQSWRISARVPAFGDVDYDAMLKELRASVNQLLREEEVDGVHVTYTGLTPVVSQAQRMLLDDLFRSFLMALVLVCGMLIVVFRSPSTGLLAMIPNVFPSVILFGGMGLLDIEVDIGTVMTASVALGIAVDDTIHFLTWFRAGYQRTGSRPEAVRFAFNRTALAMAQTTAICGLGLAPFAFAEFLPTARFSWMMLTLLAAALVGDLLLLPAILLSPLGSLAVPHSRQPAPQSEATHLPSAN